jgi:HD-like signal output (HDOD) protein
MKEEYEAIFDKAEGHSEALCSAEKEAFGFDHADAAAVLAKRWNMPETLTDALWFHHGREDQTLADAKDSNLAALTRIANLATRDDWTTQDTSTLRSCSDEESWAAIAQNVEIPDVEERARLLAEFYEELDSAQAPSF